MHICPLCSVTRNSLFHQNRDREYYRCAQCQLVFVPADQRLSAGEEKAIYQLHDNDPDDPGYRRFLSRLAEPLLHRLADRCQGLDFGCGPGPALAAILEEHGHQVALFDHFYADDEQVLHHQYDFITATEVVEHLYVPGLELKRLWQCLKPGGWLGIMTKLVSTQQAFANWHYIRDPTHVCFFSQQTFNYWSNRVQASVEFIGKDVILIHKPVPPNEPAATSSC